MAEKTDKIPRQKMPEQPAEVRRRNFDEVPKGYDDKTAMLEASRCLQCKKPSCVEGCPVEIDIPGFVGRIKEGDFAGAIAVLKQKTSLPAVCGRVCPQESQCEARCIVGKKDKPVAIGNLERFAADWGLARHDAPMPTLPAKTGKKVAVIGSGPSGITVAGDLILKGHDVTMFEAFHAAGGVLVYGIPEFRLPKRIVQAEVDYLRKLGVEVVTNCVVGKTVTIDDLLEKQGFDAAYVGVGAGLPGFLGVPGENLIGIYSANEYLTRSNLMKAYLFPEYDTPVVRGRNVAVFGAGNVAMDSARTALRMGAEKVRIVYRRGKEEMPARAEEIHHAGDEGVEFLTLTAPSAFLGDEKGRVRGMVCLQCELGEPDESGRCRPQIIDGSEFTLECDLVIIAVGSGANPVLTRSTPGLALNKRGYIVADPKTGKTRKPRVWAGGDIVTGAATVILAMGAGRKAALSMLQTFGIS